MPGYPDSIDAALACLESTGYVPDRSLATVVFLAGALQRPLFLEGEAGVGKTEVAVALSQALGRRLIRLQCYEGLDSAAAVCEWNYAAQMVEIRLAEASGAVRESGGRAVLGRDMYSERFLIRRPVLEALDPPPGPVPVLLIDELDRADEPFEAFLLEALSAFQVTIPELGVIRARTPPIVILTSNRTREVHDALKRRCLYHWIDYPSAPRELAILRSRVPDAEAELAREIVAFISELRLEDMFKHPGVAESLDWARALTALGRVSLAPEAVSDTLGAILKYQEDIELVRDGGLAERVEKAREAAAGLARDGTANG